MTAATNTILQASGVEDGSDLAAVIAGRGNIFEMTQRAEEAVLRPRETGAFSHQLRAAIAARIARQAGDAALADLYRGDAEEFADLAQPEATGTAQGLGPVLTFVDRVSNQTRDIAPEDIAILQAGGISDADIVRLCEIVAFLAYQLRVAAGLRLMQGAPS